MMFQTMVKGAKNGEIHTKEENLRHLFWDALPPSKMIKDMTRAPCRSFSQLRLRKPYHGAIFYAMKVGRMNCHFLIPSHL